MVPPRLQSHRSEMYRTPLGTRQSPLTKLYSDAKHIYQALAPSQTVEEAPEIQSLHRKFRMQKDRLLAWGFDWSDNSSADGNIDESVERAGMTEVVTSVLENVTEILDRTQKLRNSKIMSPAGYPLDKPSSASGPLGNWTTQEASQYEDLIKDLSSSLDLLCDLSKSRREDFQMFPSEKRSHEKQGLYPPEKQPLDEPGRSLPRYPDEKGSLQPAEPISALKLDRNVIIMPEETPPPYDTSGMPMPVRIVGRLRTGVPSRDFKGTTHPTSTRPVLIEYASFDNLYQNTGVPLPFSRVEQLSAILRQDSTEKSLLRLIGYFEDSPRPRIGLIYELPASIRPDLPSSAMAPVTLQTLLQNSIKHGSEGASAAVNLTPALEQRFYLAREVVAAANKLLNHDFTHRDLNSSSIIFFPSTSPSNASFAAATPQVNLRDPVLGSFDLFSEYNLDAPEESLHQNMYRHPDDPRLKGAVSSSDYEPRFDMYSLGLILLEVGLWSPVSHFFKEKYTLQDFKIRIERIWARKLASKCGSAYMRAVQDCFQAANQRLDVDSLRGVLERVTRRIGNCCHLDDGEDEVSGPQLTGFVSSPPPLTSSGQSRTDTGSSVRSPPSRHNTDFSIDGDDESMVGLTPRNTASRSNTLDVQGLPSLDRALAEEPDSRSTNSRKFFPLEDVPLEAREKFQNGVDERLGKLLSRVLPRREACDFSLELMGTTLEVARPTVVVTCQSTKLVQSLIKRHFRKEREMFDFAILPGRIMRSKARGKDKLRRSNNKDESAKHPDHQLRPICGASIGAWQDLEHSPAASFGGLVLVDGEPFGMSVHHLLEQADEDEDEDEEDEEEVIQPLTRSSAKVTSVPVLTDETKEAYFITYEDSDEDFDDDESDVVDQLSDIENDDDDDDDEFHEGDTAGIEVGEGDEIIITQPAISDVDEDFFPSEEDKDEDHLDSHTLGYVHASSGLRRLAYAAINHEIDWALFKLKDERLQPINLIAGGRRYSASDALGTEECTTQLVEPISRFPYPAEQDQFPEQIAQITELGGLQVHCYGRTSGLESGQILQRMQYLRLPGRSSFTRSWAVSGNFGMGGDSGAWVADDKGRICGHVLAWSSALQRAYIAPMEVLFEDIKQTLGALDVRLPGPQAQVAISKSKHETVPVKRQPSVEILDLSNVSLDGRATPNSRLMAQHMLMSGKQSHMEREWSRWRNNLGQMSSS